MAKPRTPKDNQEKDFQDKMRKRLTGLFSGGEEPPTFMSLRQVDELKARVADLEAKLGQKQPEGIEFDTTMKENADASSLNTEPAGLNDYIAGNEGALVKWPEPAVQGNLDSMAKNQEHNKLNFLQRWVEPAATINDEVERRQASLVSALLLVLVLAIISGPFAEMFVLHNPTSALILAGMGTGFIIAYIVSRTRSYRLAVPILLAALAAWPILNIALVKNYSQAGLLITLIFDVLLIIVSSTFASFSTTVYLSVANFLAILLLPVLIPGVQFGNIVTPLSFNGVVSALVLVFTQHRNLMEKDRLTEISQANHALRVSYGSLDARTRELQFASAVGRTVTENVADVHGMLFTAVDMICTQFRLYYAQVYLIDASGKSLTLRAGSGNVGRELLEHGHHLAVGAGSLNGRAVSEKCPLIVPDVKNDPGFLPNPLLPNTRSEMVVPLIAGGEVVGTLDLQSEKPGALNIANLPAFESLAGQLAIAIQNAALFAQAEQARSEVESQIGRLTETGWHDFLDAVERGHKIGYSYDQTSLVPLEPDAISQTPAGVIFSTPITLTGTKIGAIELALEPDRIWTNSETELIEGAATQLAQHIENLRLLAQAEKYRAEAEQAVRRLTREGWDAYLQPGGQETSGFVYDLNAIAPLDEGAGDDRTPGTHQPLKVRDEVIGELSIIDDNNSQEGANELMSAVAAQLSAHIENLRLSLSNMNLLKTTEERAQREQTLRQITVALRGSTNPATIMRTAVRELGSILGRKTVVQLLNPERTPRTEPALSGENEPDSSAKRS